MQELAVIVSLIAVVIFCVMAVKEFKWLGVPLFSVFCFCYGIICHELSTHSRPNDIRMGIALAGIILCLYFTIRFRKDA